MVSSFSSNTKSQSLIELLQTISLDVSTISARSLLEDPPFNPLGTSGFSSKLLAVLAPFTIIVLKPVVPKLPLALVRMLRPLLD